MDRNRPRVRIDSEAFGRQLNKAFSDQPAEGNGQAVFESQTGNDMSRLLKIWAHVRATYYSPSIGATLVRGAFLLLMAGLFVLIRNAFTPKPNWEHPFIQEMDREMQLFSSEADPPTPSEIDALEEQVGWKLPDAYRKFLLRYGAVSCEAKESVWPRPSIGFRGPNYMFDYRWDLFGIGHEIPGHLHLIQVRDRFRKDHPDVSREIIPLFNWAEDADIVCLDRSGQLLRWDHECGDMLPLDVSFDEFLVKVTRDLRNKKERVKTDKGAPKRRCSREDDLRDGPESFVS
jgi:hypothetical protein